jgi:hypothetical protein
VEALNIEENGFVYVSQDKIPLYTVEEVFKCDGATTTTMMVGDTIPIVWATDTGYQEMLPNRFNETEGFLGFLSMIGDRFINGSYISSYQQDKETIPFSMSACTIWNTPWSEVSESNRTFLREQEEPECTIPAETHPDIVSVIDVPGEPNPGGISWADSYSVGSNCYCATTFDHGIGVIIVETPLGLVTVRKVCELLGPGPGLEGRPIYNDIQCGNGPPNDVGDEERCPGRTDIGPEGCGQIGPKWNFENITGFTSSPTTSPTETSSLSSPNAVLGTVTAAFVLGVASVMLVDV